MIVDSDWCEGNKCAYCQLAILGLLCGAIAPFFVPFIAILMGFRKLSGSFEPSETIMLKIKHYKLCENVGEALPQLILSIMFIVNYWDDYDMTINVVTAIFSSGSVLFGLITSGKAWCDEFPCDCNQFHQ